MLLNAIRLSPIIGNTANETSGTKIDCSALTQATTAAAAAAAPEQLQHHQSAAGALASCAAIQGAATAKDSNSLTGNSSCQVGCRMVLLCF